MSRYFRFWYSRSHDLSRHKSFPVFQTLIHLLIESSSFLSSPNPWSSSFCAKVVSARSCRINAEILACARGLDAKMAAKSSLTSLCRLSGEVYITFGILDVIAELAY